MRIKPKRITPTQIATHEAQKEAEKDCRLSSQLQRQFTANKARLNSLVKQISRQIKLNYPHLQLQQSQINSLIIDAPFRRFDVYLLVSWHNI